MLKSETGKTLIETVHLNINDLDKSLAFYTDGLGFKVHRKEAAIAHLGAGSHDLLVLTEDKRAQRSLGTTGLYHFAVLVPSRAYLAHSLQRIVDKRITVQGFADHLVSEAIYLPDPDGIGIELYHDKPRVDWPFKDGKLQMATDPLDVQNLLAEIGTNDINWDGLSSKTIIGHIHLQVAQIPESEAFYQDIIGFDLVQRYGKSASFLSAEGYHHHVGINTWLGVDALPPPPGSIGLRYFVLSLPNEADYEQMRERLEQSNFPYEETVSGLRFGDPSSNAILVKSISTNK